MITGNFVDSSNDGELAPRRATRHVTGVIRKIFSLFVAFAGLLSASPAQADDSSGKASPAKVVVIPIREQIANPELFILRRGIQTPKKIHAIIVFFIVFGQ